MHTADTPLHRAFSCYAFSTDGRLLVTRRADTWATSPGVWTNTVCGHPAPGESDVDAVTRRAAQELGLRIRRLQPALPGFRYRAASHGVVENEICPVYLATVDATVDEPPRPHPAEVSQVRWTRWPEFLADLHDAPEQYSPWCRLQTGQPQLHHAVQHYLAPMR